MSARQFFLTQPQNAPGDGNALKGFTLIEMIGVLAVLAILATILISTTTSSLDVAAVSLERTNLVNYAAALQNNILRSRYIPGAGDWYTVIAGELGASVWSVTNNSRSIQRCFLIDPAMQIGTNPYGVLPYAQSNQVQAIASGGLTNPPSSPRLMIVTTLSALLLPDFITNGTYTANNFNNLWNWTDQSFQPPSDWPLNWTNRGADIIVQRINLASLFMHLTLQNYPPPPLSTIQGQYAIDRLATNTVPMNPTNGVNTYLLKNTVLSLLQDAGSGGTLQADQVLSRDASFFYIQQVWRGTLAYGTNIYQSKTQAAVGSAYLATVQAFVSSPYNAYASGGTTPPMVVNTMSNFMWKYNTYAGAGFPNSGPYINASIAQSAMQTSMNSLVTNLIPGGCNPAP